MPKPRLDRDVIENPSHVPHCTKERAEHRWRVVRFVPFALFGVLPPWLTVRCRRCGLILHAEIRRVTRPLTPHRRRAAHAAKKGTHR